jgi:hypothetical protein
MSDNPFLLPPGGGRSGDAKPPTHRPLVIPDAVPTPHPAHYIAVPASVESATHRMTRPAEPAPAPPVDAVAEDTRLASASHSAPNSWTLLLPDGTRVPLTRALLVGRDPAGIPDRPDAELLALADPGKTVSKTHALLEPTPDGVRVRELHSTNGAAVDTAEARRVLTAGGELTAPLGSTILLGSFRIGVAAG